MMDIGTTADVIRHHGRARPDAPAIEFEGRTLTFGQLDERSNRVANALADLGVGSGDRVAVLDKSTPEFFELLFAVAKLNAVLVPVNWRLAPPEIAQIVRDATASVLFVGPDFAATIAAIRPDLGSVGTLVAVGGPVAEGWLDYETALAAGAASDPGVAASGADVALQLYTSGTTGLPKGVMLTNDNVFRGVVTATTSWRLSPESVQLIVMPMFHIAGCGTALVGLYHGCRTVLTREVDPTQILELIPRFGVTNTLWVPAVIQFLLMHPAVGDTDFSTLHTIIYGASPITDSVLVRALDVFGADLIQVYGLTETTGAITQLDPDDHDPVDRPHLLRSCGKPYPWVELRIVDAETGGDVPTGSVGEVWTRSIQNMAGYWANEAATQAAITPDGWFRTGDAGFLDADGFLFLHDRVKDMIVSGGENVYPAEVENVLMRHPAVADVAVVGVPDATWGEAVKAVVVRAAGSDPSPDELIAFARQHLAGFKLPKSIDFADELPRNPSGKLLKRIIRAPYWEGRDRQIG